MIALTPTRNFTFAGAEQAVFYCNQGEGLPRHEHEYAHVTACFGGSIVVRKEGKEYVLTKDSTPLLLVAGEWHEIEALEPNTVFVNTFADGKY